MKTSTLVMTFLAAIMPIAASCGSETTGDGMKSTDAATVDAASWTAVAGLRVFFAHQSVGANILQGVAVLGSEAGRTLPVVRAEDPAAVAGPGIYEAPVGRNGDGRGKIDHFARLLDGGLGDKVDVAFMKLCYVDIDEHTDARALFEHYRATLEGLRARHPGVTFVHVTAPLQGPPGAGAGSGLKQFMKRALGKEGPGPARNAKREEYNALLRAAYAGREPVFDLAALESTRPDGSQAVLKHEGREVPRLAGEYTYDGGHLNELGRRLVAQKLLIFLAGLRAC